VTITKESAPGHPIGEGPRESYARRLAELCSLDREVESARACAAVTQARQRPGQTLAEIVETVMEGYSDRPALGQRARELVTDPDTGRTALHLLPAYTTVSYGEVWSRVRAVAGEWRAHPDHRLSAGDVVCILGFPSPEFVVVDLACLYTGAISVSLQPGGRVPHHVSILAETLPRILAVGLDHLEDAVKAVLAGAAVQRLIVFDYQPLDDDQRATFDDARTRLAEISPALTLETLDDVTAAGTELPGSPVHVPHDNEDLVLNLIYTSGSTGTPKGVMYTDSMLRRTWLRSPAAAIISVNYMPMSHMYARAALARALSSGGRCYFPAKSDMSTLFNDIGLVRPTHLDLVPRVAEMILEEYQRERDRHAPDGVVSEKLDERLRADIRDRFLGGRVLSVSSSSAPLAAETRNFIETTLDLPVQIGYGATEMGSVTSNNRVDKTTVIDYKLVDVPELGYAHTDKPYPRGELYVKTKYMTPGYYKRPDVNAEMFDADGFYKTGDIMAFTGPDELRYVDRRNNVLKLSQGEFIAVAQLEAAFAASPLIAQIFIYGSSEQPFLVGVVVPRADVITRIKTDGSGQVKAAIAASMREIAAEQGLQGYEVPRDFLIETEPFTFQNGLLTGSSKFARVELSARYGRRLEDLYGQIRSERAEELRVLRAGGDQRPVLDTVVQAAAATIGIAPAEVSGESRFTDLGGDSLSALTFSTLLADIYGVEVPVGAVIDPTADLNHVARQVSSLRLPSSRPTFVGVHGRNRAEIHATELTLDKFIDADTLQKATTMTPPGGSIDTVLVTGATGFLGRFICLSWMQLLAKTGGKVVCLARGVDAQQARRRVEDGFNTDPALWSEYQSLAGDHIDVLAGDIGETNLGLDAAAWDRLADQVDLIVHPAAHVNHVLPYDQLFNANVVGTAELIKLALTRKLKPFNYVSSVGAASVGAGYVDEDADLRLANPTRNLRDTRYARGYGASKWAGEVLMRQVHDVCGLPVAVFRPDMIMAHSGYAGQLNVPDMITRLLLSVVATGIAPNSFYRAGHQHSAQAHFDGLPVDFVAQFITRIGTQSAVGFHTYNVVNPHDDGVSLDQFVDWLVEAGNPINRICDHDKWISQFESALRNLPENLRQHSVLGVLDAFRRPMEPEAGSAVPCSRYRQATEDMHFAIPHLSASLIHRYSSGLHALKLV